MYQPQSSIPTALQALMVLRQQANPTAPGPGGQPIPTVAAQTAQQMMPPMQQPVQETAERTATGNAIQDQQQAQADEAFRQQMLAQQQAKAQQPVLAAEGGIASLDVSGMDDYADGGVVGFAEGGQPKRAIERLWDWLKSIDEESQKARWAQASETAPAPAPAPVASEQAEDLAKQEAITRGMQQFMGQGSGAEPAPREESKPPAPVKKQGVAQLVEQKAAPAPAAQGPQLDTAQIDSVFNKYVQRPELSGLKGLVEQYNKMLEGRPNYEADKLRAINEAYEKEKAARAGDRFFGALRAPYGGIGAYYGDFEAKSRAADLAHALKQTEMPQAQRDAIIKEMASRIEASKLVPGIEAQYAPSQMSLASNVMTGVGALQREEMQRRANLEREELQRRANLELERLRQSGAERIAALKGEGASAKPIYDTINDNVEKQLTAWSKQGMNKYASDAEIAAQRAKFVADQIRFAKTAGHTITPEMEALIKGTSAAPGTRENPIKLD